MLCVTRELRCKICLFVLFYLVFKSKCKPWYVGMATVEVAMLVAIVHLYTANVFPLLIFPSHTFVQACDSVCVCVCTFDYIFPCSHISIAKINFISHSVFLRISCNLHLVVRAGCFVVLRRIFGAPLRAQPSCVLFTFTQPFPSATVARVPTLKRCLLISIFYYTESDTINFRFRICAVCTLRAYGTSLMYAQELECVCESKSRKAKSSVLKIQLDTY